MCGPPLAPLHSFPGAGLLVLVKVNGTFFHVVLMGFLPEGLGKQNDKVNNGARNNDADFLFTYLSFSQPHPQEDMAEKKKQWKDRHIQINME